MIAPLPMTTPIDGTSTSSASSAAKSAQQHGGAQSHSAMSLDDEYTEAEQHGLPILLTMHGTGVGPEQQADAYKYRPKPGAPYRFGVEGYWLLAPSRHGAHNWQGTGQLHAISAMHALARLSRRLRFAQYDGQALNTAPSSALKWRDCKKTVQAQCLPVADPLRVLFAGHSMGGAGAWHASTALPDIAIAAAPLAGWLSKEQYGDSNVYMKLDSSEPFINPRIRSTLLASVADQRADSHVSNLRGIATHVRVGAKDQTTHPFYSRRMVRFLHQYGAGTATLRNGSVAGLESLQVEEVPNQEHWWWDTQRAEDGGVVNDATMRAFYRLQRTALSAAAVWTRLAASADPHATLQQVTGRQTTLPRDLTYTSTQPSVYRTGRMGVRVLNQIHPQEPSTLSMELQATTTSSGPVNVLHVRTHNVAALGPSFVLPSASALLSDLQRAGDAALAVDGLCSRPQAAEAGHSESTVSHLSLPAIICVDGTPVRASEFFRPDIIIACNGQQAGCALSTVDTIELTGQPLRAGAFRPQVLASCTGTVNGALAAEAASTPALTQPLSDALTYISSLHTLAYDSLVPITPGCPRSVSTSDGADALPSPWNTFVLRGTADNSSWSSSSLSTSGANKAHLALSIAHAASSTTTAHLSDPDAWWTLALLARPTIPPMVRAPFCNYFPGHVAVDANVVETGYAGFTSAGY